MSLSRELQMTWTFMARKKNLLVLVPIAAYMIGWKLDKMEVERLTLFRDRSALFGTEHQPGYKPSW